MTFLVLASFPEKQILRCTNVTYYFLLWCVLKHHELPILMHLNRMRILYTMETLLRGICVVLSEGC